MTYAGRTMKKAMAIFDINPRNWYELAADREKWHAMNKCRFFWRCPRGQRITYAQNTSMHHVSFCALSLSDFLILVSRGTYAPW